MSKEINAIHIQEADGAFLTKTELELTHSDVANEEGIKASVHLFYVN